MANDYKYKPTTAFWKIDLLLRNHNDTFVIQGGQGASKTISLLMLLIDFASRNQNKEISIISDELSKMKRTVINDFLKIVLDWSDRIKGNWNKSESKYYFQSGSYIEFLGLDVHDVGKGMRRDAIYGNEANKMTFEAWRQVASRAKFKVIDFNPDTKFWGHDLITQDNFITLTFEDNEFLSEQERKSILEYKEKGYNEDGTIKNEYWANKWRVYGLGEIGSVEGRIYYWQKVTDKFYFDLDVPEYIGVDWGTVDPFAIVGVKVYDGRIYIHEYNYKSENQLRQEMTSTELAQCQDDGIVEWVFKKRGINTKYEVICDSNRPAKIQMLNNLGYIAYPAKKGRIIDRISLLQEREVFYTESSKSVEFEQENSTWKKDRAGLIFDDREDLNNHCLDASEYVIYFLHRNGIL